MGLINAIENTRTSVELMVLNAQTGIENNLNSLEKKLLSCTSEIKTIANTLPLHNDKPQCESTTSFFFYADGENKLGVEDLIFCFKGNFENATKKLPFIVLKDKRYFPTNFNTQCLVFQIPFEGVFTEIYQLYEKLNFVDISSRIKDDYLAKMIVYNYGKLSVPHGRTEYSYRFTLGHLPRKAGSIQIVIQYQHEKTLFFGLKKIYKHDHLKKLPLSFYEKWIDKMHWEKDPTFDRIDYINFHIKSNWGSSFIFESEYGKWTLYYTDCKGITEPFACTGRNNFINIIKQEGKKYKVSICYPKDIKSDYFSF